MANGPLGSNYGHERIRQADIPRVRRAERSEGRCGQPIFGLETCVTAFLFRDRRNTVSKRCRVLPYCFQPIAGMQKASQWEASKYLI